MAVSDVTNILKDALDVADLDKTPVHQKPELLFDNGPRYISGVDKTMVTETAERTHKRCAESSDDARQNQTLSPVSKAPQQAGRHFRFRNSIPIVEDHVDA
ncbi:MAG: hypothetical protein R3B95_09995 [Nitrospirales bacterium]|nr:hypothetical protein [Nitrospirales bacterium]